MSTSLVTANPKLPAAIQKLMASAAPTAMSEVTGGVTAGFPIISYKGKVWRIRKGGEEIMHLDAQQQAMPSVDIVLVQANPQPSKIFYEKKYEEGTNESPRCFSNDGFKPDQSIQAPIAKACAACPNNVWGSRITDNGKKSRACSDARRMAVVFANELTEKKADAPLYLLRVPPASLNPLKDYAEKMLAPRGLQFFALVTRISFDPTAAHPQFQFKPVRLLTDEEAEVIGSLRGGADTQRILSEAQEFPAGEAGAEGGPSEAAADAASVPAQPITPPAGKPAKPKAAMRPATEEEAGAATIVQPAAKPAAPEGDGFFADAAPPAAAKPPKAAKPKAAPVAAAPPVDEEEETPPAKPAGTQSNAEFDSMLDSILNG